MAAAVTTRPPQPREIESFSDVSLDKKALRDLVLKANKPLVFHGFIKEWSCSMWTPLFLASELGQLETRFRMCQRRSIPKQKPLMETDCYYVQGTFKDFCSWLESDNSESGKLIQYPRTGKQSTIWVGSEGAFTPCHMDTYGSNLVAQIFGRKKWTLFDPMDTDNLYPTRIPYEESSVFSKVNITSPDYQAFPLFRKATPYEVILEAGDVLLVPKHWWHFVECLDTTISINTWVEMDDDKLDRVKEAIARVIIFSLKDSDKEDVASWLNPTEIAGWQGEAFPDTMQLLKDALKDALLPDVPRETLNVDVNDIINCITSPNLLSSIGEKLLDNVRSRTHPCIEDDSYDGTSTRKRRRSDGDV
ncbi:HSPB1-associated protein 1 isoform X2 [Nematostella vectensis]|uniref:HSPB1-associated protein 1 isoform X2 n=1 Tax=Nematostella vectensis TaxID=45351 RepID=UPI00207775D6|nr:HSPB1-associated protein 1 isoform X2 [Nematostella vectensis]